MNHLLFFRTPRTYRNQLTFDSLTDVELYKRTRLTRPLLVQLRDLLHDDLSRDTRRSHAMDVETVLLAALTFYASGSFQWMASSGVCVSQSSISRAVNAVSDALCNRMGDFIKFPTDPAEVREIKQGFHRLANFPNVIGSIDCTHVRVKPPHGVDEPAYVNRKGYHSINVQAVCDHKLIVRDLVVRWPGSTHDSFIWRKSSLRQLFENGTLQDAWLLG